MVKRLRPLLRNVIEALPLPVFLIYAEFIDKSISGQWLGPYLLSSIVAILSISYLVAIKMSLSKVILGIDLYLLSGAIGLVFNITPLNQFYGELEAAGMLVWILIVSIGSVLLKGGVFGESDEGENIAVKQTAIFIAIVFFACLFSLYFQGSRLLAEVIPFVLVFTCYGVFRKTTE